MINFANRNKILSAFGAAMLLGMVGAGSALAEDPPYEDPSSGVNPWAAMHARQPAHQALKAESSRPWEAARSEQLDPSDEPARIPAHHATATIPGVSPITPLE